jgi:hypothetical protein
MFLQSAQIGRTDVAIGVDAERNTQSGGGLIGVPL